jgi:hypothetical protein
VTRYVAIYYNKNHAKPSGSINDLHGWAFEGALRE